MKAVSKVNIAGLVFQVDEEALGILEGYLNRLRGYYESQESGSEIMESIEERIADLLAEKNKGHEIVGRRSVEEVIEILGEPDWTVEEQVEEPKVESAGPCVVQKLYRDPDHRVFGGLFAGLAYYLGFKRNIFRLLFIVFAFFMEIMFHEWVHTKAPILWLFFVIAYFVLCFVIPLARTWEDRMAMKGESPDLSSINSAASQPKRRDSKPSYGVNTSPVIDKIQVGFVRLCGLLMTVFSIGLIIATGFFFFFPQLFVMNMSWRDLLLMLGVEHVDWVIIVAFAGVFALAVSMLYTGIKALFQLSNKWRVGLVLNLVFIACAITLGFLCVPIAMEFSQQTERVVNQDYSLSALSSDTLYIEQEFPDDFKIDRVKHFGDQVYWDITVKRALIYPDINIFPTSESDAKSSIRSSNIYFYNSMNRWVASPLDRVPSYELIGNRLIIKCDCISPYKPWDRVERRLDVFLPKGYKVVKKGLFLLDIDCFDEDYYHHNLENSNVIEI